ncbi:MAG TPA: zinc-dependent peptidase [Gammaproteobacteria bacterium]|nr:zinc-dependent peptidase [Gammaproteobacteria bacterium]
MYKLLRNWRERRIVRHSPITPAQWQEAFAALPLLAPLTPDEKARLRRLTILFLHRKVFEGAHGLDVSLHMALIIALQACLPILNLDLDAYDGWSAIIVYPAGFAPERTVTDEFGVVHHVQTGLAGEAWQRGPVILAWDGAEEGGHIDGQNLVIHEFAHKLDMQNGEANGFPPLHRDMRVEDWVQAFSEGYADFQLRCGEGEHTGIDCYAATSPAEFFAVLSEVFFERPDIIQRLYPLIYAQLRQYYHQDPVARMPDQALT